MFTCFMFILACLLIVGCAFGVSDWIAGTDFGATHPLSSDDYGDAIALAAVGGLAIAAEGHTVASSVWLMLIALGRVAWRRPGWKNTKDRTDPKFAQALDPSTAADIRWTLFRHSWAVPFPVIGFYMAFGEAYVPLALYMGWVVVATLLGVYNHLTAMRHNDAQAWARGFAFGIATAAAYVWCVLHAKP